MYIRVHGETYEKGQETAFLRAIVKVIRSNVRGFTCPDAARTLYNWYENCRFDGYAVCSKNYDVVLV